MFRQMAVWRQLVVDQTAAHENLARGARRHGILLASNFFFLLCLRWIACERCMIHEGAEIRPFIHPSMRVLIPAGDFPIY